MKQITTFSKALRNLFGGVVFSFFAAFAVQPTWAMDYALVVGVGAFDPLYKVDQVAGSASDTMRMQQVLYGSAVNDWTPETVTVLNNAQGAKGAPSILPIGPEGNVDGSIEGVGIRSWIAYYAGILQDGDTFLFYFSGRGNNYSDRIEYSKATYLCAYDANYSDAELVKDLSAFQPGVRVLVIVDAHCAGGLAPLQERDRMSLTSYTQTQTSNRAQIGWIQSVSYDEGAQDGGTGQAFSVAFMDAVEKMLGDEKPFGNEDGLVDAREAFLYAASKVEGKTPQMANASLVAQFVLGGESYTFYQVVLEGSTTPTLGAKEPYECVAVYTNGTESAAYAEYEAKLAAYEAYVEQKAQFDEGLLEDEPEAVEEPEEPELEGRRVVIPVSLVDAWGLAPGGADATFEAGVLTINSISEGEDTLVLSANGVYEGHAWEAELEVEMGDAAASYADALDNAVVVWNPSSWEPGSNDWFVDTYTSHDGEDSLQSGPVETMGSVSFSGSFNGRGVLSFWYKVAAESEDGLFVTVDGKEMLRATGESDWAQAQCLVGHGDHTVVFTYRKTSAEGEDLLGRAWVDEVMFVPATYAFDMNANDNGWTTGGFSNLWERGTPSFGPVSDTACWGTDLDGRYGDNVDCWLMSPVLSVGPKSFLTFRTWFDIDNQAWRSYFSASGTEFEQGWKTYLDGGFVEISINGGGWANLTPELTCPGNTATKTVAGTSAGWVVASVPLPEEAEGQSVRIRFRFASDAYVKPSMPGSPAGWFIDDVALYSEVPADLILVRTTIEDTAQGNNNGLVEPGEKVWVSFEVANQGEADMEGLVGAVQCLIPGVTLPAATTTLTYGDVAAGAHAEASPRLLVGVDESVAPGTVVRLAQTLKDASGKTYTLDASFTVVTAASLEGMVYEMDGETPIAGATVSLGIAGEATTDVSGRFLFPALVSDTYALTVSADGYSSSSMAMVKVPVEEALAFRLGKAYAELSETEFSFELVSTIDNQKGAFVISNGLLDDEATVPLSFTFEFPEGCPAWLTLDAQDGVILPGASRTIGFKVDADAVPKDPRMTAKIRVVSNDCREEFVEQDVVVTLTMEGLSNAMEYLGIAAFEGSNFPNQDGADADGYLERGESGALAITVVNGSLISLSDLVVTSVRVVEAKSEGTSENDLEFTQDLALARPMISTLSAEGTGTISPALEVRIADAGVIDPVYTIEVTLENAADGTVAVITGDYVVYDRYSVSGTVYAVPSLYLPEEPEVIGVNAILQQTVFEGANGEEIWYANPDDYESYSRYYREDEFTVVGVLDEVGEGFVFRALDSVVSTVKVDAAEMDLDDFPKVDLAYGPDNQAVIRRTELVLLGVENVYAPVEIPTRTPLAEALVMGVGAEGIVETVTLEDGTYELHGLRAGFNKIYAVRSWQSALAGMSLPVVFADLQEDLPNEAYLSAFEVDPNAIVGFDLAALLAAQPEPVPAEPAEGDDGAPVEEPATPGLDLYIPLADNAILEVVNMEVEDANRNDAIEADEAFTLSLDVGNVGVGMSHGFTMELSPIVPIDGGEVATFLPASIQTGTLDQVEDEDGNPMFDEDGRPVYRDIQLLPNKMAMSSDEAYADVLNVELTAGSETGILPVLVKITDHRIDPLTGEWVVSGVWYTTLDLIVEETVSFSGSVLMQGDEGDTPLAGTRVFLDKYSAEDPSKLVSTQIATADADGVYRFTIFDDFDATYTVRPVDLAGALAPDGYEGLPGDEPRDDLDLVYTPIEGLTVSPSPLELEHAEGESIDTSLTIDNQTEFDVEVTSVAVRYTRTSADVATAKANLSFASGVASGVADTGTASSDDGLDVAGELFVTFRSNVAIAEQDSLLEAHGLEVVKRYRLVKAIHCRFDASRITYDALRAELLASGLVAKVDTVRVIPVDLNSIESSVGATDPLASLQWALFNERQTGGTLGEDIGALALWEKGLTGSRDVIVAVHDSGVDRNHPDLANNIWVNMAEFLGEPGVDDDGNGYVDDTYGWNFADDNNDTLDTNGHGTHVAGIIGAAANGVGTLGVNWNVSIMPIRVANADGQLEITSAQLASSFEYMVENGAQICNCSWGSSVTFSAPIVVDAVHAACDAGLLIIVAAGNDAMDCNIYRGNPYGINDDNMIVVAATDHDGKIASFSNYGDETVHIAAPGVDILSTHPAECLEAFLAEGGVAEDETHVYMDGTSMATPYVTGAAALLLASSPDTPTSLIREAILRGARVDPNLEGWVSTSSHLDLEGALAYLGCEWLSSTTELPLDVASGDSATLDFEVNADKRLAAGTYTATIEITYTLDGQSQTLSVPVTDTVSGGIRVAIASVVVDDSTQGDGDGFAEPGETVDLYISLRNMSSAKFLNSTATLEGSNESAYPDLVPGSTGLNMVAFTLTLGEEGLTSLDLDFATTLAGEDLETTLTVELPVREAASISGRVLDAAGNGVAGSVVEFWTSGTPEDESDDFGYRAAGRVTADETGAYRFDGLATGVTAYVRAIPAGRARSEVVSLETANEQTLDLTVRNGSIWFMNLGADQTLESTLGLQGTDELTFVVTNTTDEAVATSAVLVERKSILLVSDKDGLNVLAPTLRTIGFDVDVLTNNYRYINVNFGEYFFENREIIKYTTDVALLQKYDFVVMNLDGPKGVGRKLTENEGLALQSYLDRGGRLLVTGGNLLSRPDDPELAKLLGDASMDRIDAELYTARPEVQPYKAPTWDLPGVGMTSFAELSGDETITLPGNAFAADVASPALAHDAIATYGEAEKIYRYESGNGTLFYWGGNVSSSEVAARGVWQDLFRDLIASELYQPVAWATPGQVETLLAAKSSAPYSVALDAAGLKAGDYKATLLLFGSFADAETAAIHVTLHVTRPVFTAYSNTGVTNAYGAYLTGDGQPGSFVYQLILTEDPTGAVSAPDANGLPANGETVVATFATGLYYGLFGSAGIAPNLGQFSERYEIPNEGKPVYAVMRAWTGTAPGAGAFWGDSKPYAVQFTEDESYNFGTWCVGTLYEIEGAPAPDSNNDGVPDWYVLENFPGMDPTAPISIESSAEFTQEIKNGSMMYAPYRVFVTENYIYVLDNNQKRITVWTPNGNNGSYVGFFKPAGLQQFSDPVGMDIQPGANRFAVADAGRHVVHVFEFNEEAIAAATSPNLTTAFTYVQSVGTIDTPYGKSNASGVEGLFTAAKGVAMDSDGAIYVADTGASSGEAGRRVLIFNPDGSLRSTLRPAGDATLVNPAGIDVDDATGDIYVANTGAGNIVRLSANGVPLGIYTGVTMTTTTTEPQIAQVIDYTTGRYYIVTNGYTTITSEVVGPVGPTDVKVWNVGSTFRLIVADRDGNAIHILDSNGTFIATFTNPVASADTYNRVGNFRQPWGVYPIADSSEAWVADTRNNRLQHLVITLDGDHDGIDDTIEMLNGRDPTVADQYDTDGDGISDAMELLLGTDPEDPDSDGDGLSDFEEVNGGTDPTTPDENVLRTLNVSAQPAEGGTVTVVGGPEQIAGDTATLTVEPAVGWTFVGWQDSDDTSLSRDVRVGLYGNDYIALFEREAIVVTVSFVDTNNVPVASRPDQTISTYYGLVFHQDLGASFDENYVFVGGYDSLASKIYFEPVIDFEALSENVTVTFMGELSAADPAGPEVTPPAIHATSIRVDGSDLYATFSTDATDIEQLYTFINRESHLTRMIYADSLENLAAYRKDKTHDTGIDMYFVSVEIDPDTLGFSIKAESIMSESRDALFIIGFTND